MDQLIEKIEAALTDHPLCQKIARFLISHEGVMDTVDGVARCWVDSDVLAVKSALDCLQTAGIVVTHVLSSGVYYSLTPHGELRGWLKARQGDAKVPRPVLLEEESAAQRDVEQNVWG